MYSQELKERLDELPTPTTAKELEEVIGNRQHGDMFFATDGLPRAYFEIPTGFPDNGDYRMPPVLRVIYHVLAYKKQLRDGEDVAAAEPELVACMWDDFKRIRVKMAEQYGEMTPVLFWRRRPEFSDDSTEGDKARYAKIYLRVSVPGYDFHKHRVLSHLGRDGISGAAPCPVSAAQKDEMLFADEVLKLSDEASKAYDAHLNAFQKLMAMRTKRTYEEMSAVNSQPAHAGLYGAGAGLTAEEQARTNSALRAMLDSQAMESHPPTVHLGGQHSMIGVPIEEAADPEVMANIQNMQAKLAKLGD